MTFLVPPEDHIGAHVHEIFCLLQETCLFLVSVWSVPVPVSIIIIMHIHTHTHTRTHTHTHTHKHKLQIARTGEWYLTLISTTCVAPGCRIIRFNVVSEEGRRQSQLAVQTLDCPSIFRSRFLAGTLALSVSVSVSFSLSLSLSVTVCNRKRQTGKQEKQYKLCVDTPWIQTKQNSQKPRINS